jgi:hypothetical protein
MLRNDPLRLPPFHFDADPDPAFHFDADPDPSFHLDADPDPTFHSNADPDPAVQNDADPDPRHCKSTIVSVPLSELAPPTPFPQESVCPGIHSKESVLPVYVAWRAGTTTLFLLGS